jgi:hypothetical protein
VRAVIAVLVLAVAAPAQAEPTDRIFASIGMDTTLVSRLGYERALAVTTPGLSFALAADVTLPIFGPAGGDGELRVGALAQLRRGAWFELGVALRPFLRGTRNEAHDAVATGIDLEIAPALRRGGFTLGIELGYNRAIATYLNHTASYREEVYPAVVDGWYGMAAATLRAGLQIQRSLGRIRLQLRAGRVATGALASEAVPLYAELGAALAM